MPTAIISALALHPVKGARGIAVHRWSFSRQGLRYDREWMVVKDVPEGPCKFLSQRELPKLALVVPELPAELLQDPTALAPPGSSLTLTAPGMTPLHVPLELTPDAPLRTIRVWEWEGKTLDMGDKAAAWISQYLGQPARIVRYVGSETLPALASAPGAADEVVRRVEPQYVEPGAPMAPETRLSDGYPILLASETSMADLNARIAASSETGKGLVPLPIERFRANVVLSGLQPWEEDRWRTVRFVGAAVAGGVGKEDVTWKAVKPCARCKVPTIDPYTAEPSKGEPSDTLATFRTGQLLGYSTKTFKHAVFFGVNIVPATGQEVHHVLEVGGTVELSEAQVEF